MESVPVPAEGGTLASWRVPGPEPPLVCVHGAGVSSRAALPFVAEMSGRRQTWTVDLPGFGRSRTAESASGVGEFRDALVQFLDGASLPSAHVLGWSFGAQIAVSLAVRFPQRVRGLVLIGPTIDPVARSFPRQLLRWLANSPQEPPGLTPQVAKDYRDAGWRRVWQAFRGALTDEVEDALPQVRVPVLVVRGEHDRMVPQPWAEEVTRLLVRGELVVWPGAGHMVPFADPAGLARTLERFTTARSA
ncbi:alpha/beta fold hydrolase [Bounagaea algeriensis]